MPSQQAKGDPFREIHERVSAFIIPNPWDVGTARFLATLDFKALATTRTAFGAFLRAAREMVDRDTFSFAEDAVPYPELSKLFPDP